MASTSAFKENLTGGDKYRRQRVEVLQSSARQAIDFASSLSEQREEFSREYEKVTEKLKQKWKSKQEERTLIPTTFPEPIREKSSLKYRKAGSRHRAYIGLEAALSRGAQAKRQR